MVRTKSSSRLNAICAYFTMFPLDFPYTILQKHANRKMWVLDPFCGRGTTNFAARLLGMPSIGFDSSPIAVALSQAKLVNVTPEEIVCCAKEILADSSIPQAPDGDFWSLAFHSNVLEQLVTLRQALLDDCSTEERIALRAIILGALHGPKNKIVPSYFSNQSPRTYAPKPRYSVKYWHKHNLIPEEVDVLEIIRVRAERYYHAELPKTIGGIVGGDSRQRETIKEAKKFLKGDKVSFVLTSPPYYGMKTYIPDQWLRNWFLGGPPEVDYNYHGQLGHSNQQEFINDISSVWQLVKDICAPDALLVTRFGAINDRLVNSKDIIEQSLIQAGWEIKSILSAGQPPRGRRQADSFKVKSKPLTEWDVYARLA